MSSKPTDMEITFETLWGMLSTDEQMEACLCFWRSTTKTQKGAEPGVLRNLAAILNFREKFVRSKPPEWRAAQLQKRILRAPLNAFIDDVLKEWLILKHSNMICAVLDGEGTPHEGVWIPDDARVPTVEDFVRGLVAARAKYPARELFLYYSIQVSASAAHWTNLAEATERPEFQELLTAATEVPRSPKDHEKDTPQKTDAGDGKITGFTTLDTVLIRTVVAAANESDGSLSPDAIEDLIQEVLALSTERHRSFFHLGYVDSVFKRAFKDEFTGSNPARRGWRWRSPKLTRLCSPEVIHLAEGPWDFLSKEEGLCSE